MSKTAEELAYEYQCNHEQLYHIDSYPIAVVNELERNAYICGMKQAEKDLALEKMQFYHDLQMREMEKHID